MCSTACSLSPMSLAGAADRAVSGTDPSYSHFLCTSTKLESSVAPAVPAVGELHRLLTQLGTGSSTLSYNSQGRGSATEGSQLKFHNIKSSKQKKNPNPKLHTSREQRCFNS